MGVWWGECLTNLFFSSIWQKKVWQMNKSAKWLLIVTTILDRLVWQIVDDSLNLPNFLSTKFSHYTVHTFGLNSPMQNNKACQSTLILG